MFRAAFPNASDSEEKLEVAWVKDTYDLTGNNGSTKDTQITRLAGVWVGPSVALELGHAYMLGRLIEVVVEAKPDPNGNYRRSGKSAATASATTNAPTTTNMPVTVNAQAAVASPPTSIVSKPPSAAKSLPTPSPTAVASPPAKRRKESSPAVEPQSAIKSPVRQSPAPSKVATPPSPLTLRRSARTKSPAPRQPSAPPPLRTPKATRSVTKKESISLTTSLTPGGSDLTVVDEESLVVEDGVVGTKLLDQDIKEQQMLIQDLKDKRDAARKAQVETEEGMDVGGDESSSVTGKKREREDEDEPLKFDFKEPEKEERAISTNRRVSRFSMEPRTKSFAWGLAAFAVGIGAM